MKRLLSSHSLEFSFSQGLFSLSSFLLNIVLLRGLNPAEFGAASLALSFVYFAVAFQRSLVGDMMLVFAPKVENIVVAGAKVVARFSLVAFLGMAVVWVILPGVIPSYLPIMAGLIVLQDGLRYAVASGGKALGLLRGDAVWLGSSILAAGVAVTGLVSIGATIALWAVGGVLAALIQVRGIRKLRSIDVSIPDFFRVSGSLSVWNSSQFIVSNGTVQAALTAMAIAVGTHDFAGYRAMQVILGPLLVAVLALSSPLLSWITKQRARSWTATHALVAGAVLAGIAISIGFGILAASEPLILFISGPQYLKSAPLLLPGVLALVFVAANVPIAATFISIGKGRAFFVSSVTVTVPTSLVVVVLAFTQGIEAAAWSMVGQYALLAVVCASVLVCVHPSSRQPVSAI